MALTMSPKQQMTDKARSGAIYNWVCRIKYRKKYAKLMQSLCKGSMVSDITKKEKLINKWTALGNKLLCHGNVVV